jgi:hypothetical protein
MNWWRIRKVANAATWQLMMVGLGVLGGVALVAFLPGMPWSTTIQPVGAATKDALDLAAQRSMASAAWFMVVVTCASSLVSGAGLYLIARTLGEAKRSADAAVESVIQAKATTAAAELSAAYAAGTIEVTREMGKKQFRAYMAVTNVAVLPAEDTLDGHYFDLSWILFNAGQSPARRLKLTITVEAQVLADGAWTTHDSEVVTRFMADLPANQGLDDQRAFALDIGDALIDGFDEHKGRFLVHGQVNYGDVFGDWWSESFRFSKRFTDEEDWTEGSAIPREPEHSPI